MAFGGDKGWLEVTFVCHFLALRNNLSSHAFYTSMHVVIGACNFHKPVHQLHLYPENILTKSILEIDALIVT